MGRFKALLSQQIDYWDIKKSKCNSSELVCSLMVSACKLTRIRASTERRAPSKLKHNEKIWVYFLLTEET